MQTIDTKITIRARVIWASRRSGPLRANGASERGQPRATTATTRPLADARA